MKAHSFGACLTVFLSMFSVLKLSSAYYVCCIFWDALKNTLTMEANTINPDQTALKEQSDLS